MKTFGKGVAAVAFASVLAACGPETVGDTNPTPSGATEYIVAGTTVYREPGLTDACAVTTEDRTVRLLGTHLVGLPGVVAEAGAFSPNDLGAEVAAACGPITVYTLLNYGTAHQ